MKYFGLLLISLICAIHLKANKISNIDFKEVEKQISDSSSKFYYPLLLEKILNVNLTLNDSDYHFLYFGQVFQKEYSPYSRGDHEKFDVAFKKGNAKKALKLGKKYLAANPLDIDMYYYLFKTCKMSEQRDLAIAYADRMEGLIQAILRSGDGAMEETAFVVANVSDEYAVLKYYGLKLASQALLNGEFGPIDKMELRKKTEIGGKTYKALYFNITYPFTSLSSMFKD